MHRRITVTQVPCGEVGKQRIEDAGALCQKRMETVDDDIGILMTKLKDMALDDNTIVMFTTDYGTENFTWPDGGQTPFFGGKATAYEGGFRAPAMIRWPGKAPAGRVDQYTFKEQPGYKYEFWRSVLVQQKVEALAKTAIEFPPLQRDAYSVYSAHGGACATLCLNVARRVRGVRGNGSFTLCRRSSR